MADTLRTRVSRVIAGGAHALLDKLEDAAPLVVLEQAVREVAQVTADVRADLGRTVAHRHLAQQQYRYLNQEHDGLSVALATALAEGRDDLAKPAIARQLDIEAQLPILEASLGDLAQEEKELAGYVDALMGKQREMERAVHDLAAARRLADSPAATQRGGHGTVGAKVQAAQSAFDRTYQRHSGLDATGRSASLQQAAQLQALGDLVQDTKISARLATLKAAH
jgi:phage shock protein A